MLEIILAAITANTLIVGVFAFLFKSIVNHRLDKDITTFKNNLEHQAELQLSNYQSRLEEERIKLQISYGGIFEKQAEIIIELFKMINKVEDSMREGIYAESNRSEEYRLFMDSWRGFSSYFETNKILLPESLEYSLEEFKSKVITNVFKFRSAEIQINRGNLTQKQFDKTFENRDDAEDMIQTIIPGLKKELTNKLRSLIGVGEHLIKSP